MNKKLDNTFNDDIKIAYINEKVRYLKTKGYDISFQYYFSKKEGIQITISIKKENIVEKKKLLFLPFKEFELESLQFQMYLLEQCFGKMKLLKKDEIGIIHESEISKEKLNFLIGKIYNKRNFETNDSDLASFNQKSKEDIFFNRNYIELIYKPNKDDLK